MIQNVLSHCDRLQRAESLLRSRIMSKEGGREEGSILRERNVQSHIQMNEQNAVIAPFLLNLITRCELWCASRL